MQTQVYSTDTIAPRARFEFWSDVICDAYLPIRCDTPNRDTFNGRIALTRLPHLTLSRINGSPQHVRRGRSEIGRNATAYFMVSLQVSGHGAVSQNGREAALSPGDFATYSTTDPYEIRCDGPVDQLILQVPHEALLARLPQAEMLTARSVQARTELGGLLSAQLQQCAALVAGQPQTVQRHMQDMLVDVIAAGLSGLELSVLDLSRPEQMLLSRAKSYIRENLRDDELDRDAVAQAMGLSARTLARAFAREDQSVATYIRQARLDAIARDLADPRFATLSITEIGCKWGFPNAQHLSRLFKETFDQTPRAYRRERAH